MHPGKSCILTTGTRNIHSRLSSPLTLSYPHTGQAAKPSNIYYDIFKYIVEHSIMFHRLLSLNKFHQVTLAAAVTSTAVAGLQIPVSTTSPPLTQDIHVLHMNRNHRKPKRGNKTKRAVSNYSRKQKAFATRKPKYAPLPPRPLESKPEVQ